MDRISVVIPAYNEEKSIGVLHKQLHKALSAYKGYELIFVDDGSTDNTFKEMKKVQKRDSHVKLIRFQRNYGKAAALAAGFEAAQNRFVFTMDGDLQDDPAEIPRFLEKMDEGYDLVVGWKTKRKDPMTKTLPSRVFNLLTSRFVGLRLHDYNCGFKCYRKEVVKQMQVYGELHRYLPALAHWMGYKVGEMPVTHHRRVYGKSKYGFSRLFKGMFDLISIKYMSVYNKRPLHFFGVLGGGSFFIGFAAAFYLLILKLRGELIGDRPLLMLSVLLIVLGVQFVSLGLLGEMITRESKKKEYIIKEKIGF